MKMAHTRTLKYILRILQLPIMLLLKQTHSRDYGMVLVRYKPYGTIQSTQDRHDTMSCAMQCNTRHRHRLSPQMILFIVVVVPRRFVSSSSPAGSSWSPSRGSFSSSPSPSSSSSSSSSPLHRNSFPRCFALTPLHFHWPISFFWFW